MFDSGYSYKQVDKKEHKQAPLLREFVFKFKTKHGRGYIVRAEEYSHHIFVIKFYPKKYKTHPNKYNIQLNDNDAIRVITTIVKIAVEFWKDNQSASFGFIGSHSVFKDGLKEDKKETRRYKIYKYIAVNLLSEEEFKHVNSPDESAYILINKKNQNPDHIIKMAAKMFVEYYPSSDEVKNIVSAIEN